MTENRDTLKKAYKDVILNFGCEKDLQTKCFLFLQENEAVHCFKLLPLKDILLKDFLEKTSKKRKVEFRHLEKLFRHFEKYAARILLKPWCKDYYRIKEYTGFWKYNFEQWLCSETIYRIFNLIGYKKTSRDTLTLDIPADEERVLTVGFELYLAHTQIYFLKSTDFLCSKYSLKTIIEGWFNTTGNPVAILEWLRKNSSRREVIRSDVNECYQPGVVVLHEKTRPKFTVTSDASYYDKNGDSIADVIKYPPKIDEQHKSLYFAIEQNVLGGDSVESEGFPSLSTINVPDTQLYGDTEQAFSAKEDVTSILENYYSKPSNYDELLGNVPHDDKQTFRVTNAVPEHSRLGIHIDSDLSMLNSTSHIVARGGNSEHNNSPMYGNALENTKMSHSERLKDFSRIYQGDYTALRQEKDKFVGILAKRIESGEKSFKQNPLTNQNDQFTTVATRANSSDLLTEAHRNIRYREQADQRGEIIDLPDQENVKYLSNGIDSGLCVVCGKSPTFCCKKCKDILCGECTEYLSERPCVDRMSGHDYEQISLV